MEQVRVDYETEIPGKESELVRLISEVSGMFGKLLWSADKKKLCLCWIYKVIITMVIRPLDDPT